MNHALLFLKENDVVKKAMSIIDKTKAKLALVLDKKDSLIGTVTDGDIRRAILRGEALQSPVENIMNKKFKYLEESISINKSNSFFKDLKKESIRAIPVINKEKKVVKVIILDEIFGEAPVNSPVIIMAGGKGSRLYPITENCPKPMLQVGGKPMLELIINNYVSNGFKKFYISVNYMKDKIINYFGDGKKLNIEIEYLIEEKPLGTAGSLSLLPKTIDDTFIVINGDVITQLNPLDLLNFHESQNADGTLCAVETEFNFPYGVLETNGINLEGIKEKPSYKNLINAGIYVLNPKLISFIEKGKYLDMPDLFIKAKLNKKKMIVYPIHEYWIDVGLPDKFKKVQLDIENGKTF